MRLKMKKKKKKKKKKEEEDKRLGRSTRITSRIGSGSDMYDVVKKLKGEDLTKIIE
jgi:hypothetical protein